MEIAMVLMMSKEYYWMSDYMNHILLDKCTIYIESLISEGDVPFYFLYERMKHSERHSRFEIIQKLT